VTRCSFLLRVPSHCLNCLMMMGSSAVSPWVSTSIVAFSAASDGLASISSAAGASFIGTFFVGPVGWAVVSSVLTVGDFLVDGDCGREILFALWPSSLGLSISDADSLISLSRMHCPVCFLFNDHKHIGIKDNQESAKTLTALCTGQWGFGMCQQF